MFLKAFYARLHLNSEISLIFEEGRNWLREKPLKHRLEKQATLKSHMMMTGAVITPTV